MNGTSVYTMFDGYIEAEINKKLNLRLDELQDTLISAYPMYSEQIIAALKKQRYPVQSVLRLDAEKKKRRKKQLNPESRCMARTGLDTQCRRPRVGETRYCQSHSYSLPYDDFELKLDLATTKKITKKRGRRGKGKQHVLENLDQSKYVQAVVLNIGDTAYLVDENDVIYNFNQNNEIVGYIKNEEVHWC
jgi:hypothetical protein